MKHYLIIGDRAFAMEDVEHDEFADQLAKSRSLGIWLGWRAV